MLWTVATCGSAMWVEQKSNWRVSAVCSTFPAIPLSNRLERFIHSVARKSRGQVLHTQKHPVLGVTHTHKSS